MYTVHIRILCAMRFINFIILKFLREKLVVKKILKLIYRLNTEKPVWRIFIKLAVDVFHVCYQSSYYT